MTTQAPPPDSADPWTPPGEDAVPAPAQPGSVPPYPEAPYQQAPYQGGPYWPPYPMAAPAPAPRTGKGVVARAGVILGVLALLVSAGGAGYYGWTVHQADQRVKAEQRADRERAEAEAAEKERKRKEAEVEAEKKAAEERARHLAFGQTYTYPDGLTVTVAGPEPYAVDRSVRLLDGTKAYQLKVTVVNGGSKAVKITGLPTVREPGGRWYQLLIDGSGRLKFLKDELQPGEQSVGVFPYAVQVDPEKLEVVLTPGLSGRASAYWGGVDRTGAV